MMCLEVGLFGFLLLGTLCDSWICLTFSLIKLGKFSIITFSNTFYIPWSSSPTGIPCIMILLCFMLSCISLNPSSFFLNLFSFSYSFWVFFSTLSSSLPIQFSASSSLLLILSTVSSVQKLYFSFSWPLLIVSISFFMLI